MQPREPQRKKINKSGHSSISSCDIKSDEVADLEISKIDIFKKNLNEF